MRRRNMGTFIFMLLLALSATSFAQSPAPSSQATTAAVHPAENTKHEPAADSKNAKLSPADARKAQILEDTNRLYRMAEELKAEVAKSNKDILSVAVVKKADEIEKLAKSLKERMRNE